MSETRRSRYERPRRASRTAAKEARARSEAAVRTALILAEEREASYRERERDEPRRRQPTHFNPLSLTHWVAAAKRVWAKLGTWRAGNPVGALLAKVRRLVERLVRWFRRGTFGVS